MVVNLGKLRNGIFSDLCQEIRTPLTVLHPTLKLLIREKFTESSAVFNMYVEGAISSANGINTLVDKLGKFNTLRKIIDLDLRIKVPTV